MWDYILKFAAWFKDIFLWLPKKLWAEILDVLAGAIDAIGAPSFITQAGNAFNSIPPEFLFFATKLAVPEGIAMMLSALIARFVLRRIPFIG